MRESSCQSPIPSCWAELRQNRPLAQLLLTQLPKNIPQSGWTGALTTARFATSMRQTVIRLSSVTFIRSIRFQEKFILRKMAGSSAPKRSITPVSFVDSSSIGIEVPSPGIWSGFTHPSASSSMCKPSKTATRIFQLCRKTRVKNGWTDASLSVKSAIIRSTLQPEANSFSTFTRLTKCPSKNTSINSKPCSQNSLLTSAKFGKDLFAGIRIP